MKKSSAKLKIEYCPLASLTPYAGNPRTHSPKQIRQIAASIRQFGFTLPILVDARKCVMAGHARLLAARLLGLESLPTIRLDHLSEGQKRAYIIADNKLAENAGWDRELLVAELQYLAELDIDFELTVTGFETAEIDLLLETAGDADADMDDGVGEELRSGPAVSCAGDLWQLGDHRLLCADATKSDSFEQLLGGARAQMVFTDPPYNVRIAGNVSGLGTAAHREFAMASGEMSESAFIEFLTTVLGHLFAYSVGGSIHFVCMGWRHAFELLSGARAVKAELKNVCVWAKSNGGMGSFYRSQHEFVFVLKRGSAPHINNIELGKHGRNRSNVWEYPGLNGFGEERLDELRMHPTVKPVALVADAILDCSNRRGLVLDCFGGSGTTVLACERTGRLGRVMEIDPGYVDVAIRRFQKATGKAAVHAANGQTFSELEREHARTDRAADPVREEGDAE